MGINVKKRMEKSFFSPTSLSAKEKNRPLTISSNAPKGAC